MEKNFIFSITKVIALCIVIFSVSAFFVYDVQIIGWVMLALGLLCFGTLKLFKIVIRSVWPDIAFGLIDNGTLAIFTVVGGEIAGVAGAVIGGAVGNAITDGIAGTFEGHIAEKLRKNNIPEERTVLGSAIGKMTGCLLGAGIVLIIANLIKPGL